MPLMSSDEATDVDRGPNDLGRRAHWPYINLVNPGRLVWSGDVHPNGRRGWGTVEMLHDGDRPRPLSGEQASRPGPAVSLPGPERNRSSDGHVTAILIVVIAIVVLAAIGLHRQPSSTAVSSSDGATAARVAPAVVSIDTKLGSSAEAAGTGMIIGTSGEVLTNNHVIADATDIRVYTDGTSTGHAATVVGYDVTDDIAVIQVAGVYGLPTINLGNFPKVAVGEHVVTLGNAGGRGGAPAMTAGKVTALDQPVTASDATGKSETLAGMMQTDAVIQPGDSGGPLINTRSQVIGMDTAAAFGGFFQEQTGTSTSFAIPIHTAITIADQIVARHATDTIHIGARALLGVEVTDVDEAPFGYTAPLSYGALVVTVQPKSPAATAGISPGDIITAVDTKEISQASDLESAMNAFHPHDRVTIRWVDTTGHQHRAAVSASSGPPA